MPAAAISGAALHQVAIAGMFTGPGCGRTGQGSRPGPKERAAESSSDYGSSTLTVWTTLTKREISGSFSELRFQAMPIRHSGSFQPNS